MRSRSRVAGSIFIFIAAAGWFTIVACGGSSSSNSPPQTATPLDIPPMPASARTTDQSPPPNAAKPHPPDLAKPHPPDDENGSGTSGTGIIPLAVPSPIALPCSSDSQCATHRCNLQYGKCAFPCTSDADCIQGASCFTGAGPTLAACVPTSP